MVIDREARTEPAGTRRERASGHADDGRGSAAVWTRRAHTNGIIDDDDSATYGPGRAVWQSGRRAHRG